MWNPSAAGEGQEGGGDATMLAPIARANETRSSLGLLFTYKPVPLHCSPAINEARATVQQYCKFCCWMSL